MCVYICAAGLNVALPCLCWVIFYLFIHLFTKVFLLCLCLYLISVNSFKHILDLEIGKSAGHTHTHEQTNEISPLTGTEDAGFNLLVQPILFPFVSFIQNYFYGYCLRLKF